MVYKVYSNGEKEQTNDFTYSKELVDKTTNSIIITYNEDGIESKIEVPITVTDHIHDWEEWHVTKEPTETEEGLKERVCSKNRNHKELAKIDKLISKPSIIPSDTEQTKKTILGESQKISRNDNKNIIININSNNGTLEKILIDNEELNKKNYTINEENTKITIFTEYLQTLNLGEHTIKVIFNQGSELILPLTITPEKEESIDSNDSIETTGETNNKSKSTITKTQITKEEKVNKHHIIYIILIPMIGIILLITIRKLRNNNR